MREVLCFISVNKLLMSSERSKMSIFEPVQCFSVFLLYIYLLLAEPFCKTVDGYYTAETCYGTGDCIINTGYLTGGPNSDLEHWLMECNDGEGMVGIFDESYRFTAISKVWCHFMFPLKPPSNGIYPYYPICNVRNFTLREFYCYDKFYPGETVDTFVTGVFAYIFLDPPTPVLMKCCKTPAPYKLDYNRCQWKYTHDKRGEHYENVWLTKCDTDFVMTGIGMAANPWDRQYHYVYIQCCPVITT